MPWRKYWLSYTKSKIDSIKREDVKLRQKGKWIYAVVAGLIAVALAHITIIYLHWQSTRDQILVHESAMVAQMPQMQTQIESYKSPLLTFLHDYFWLVLITDAIMTLMVVGGLFSILFLLERTNVRLAQKVRAHTASLRQNLAIFKGYKEAMDESSIVSKSDLKGVITYVNDKLCDVTGFTRAELMGKPHNVIRHPDTPNEVFREMWEAIQSKRSWKGQIKNRKKNGEHYWVDTVIKPILDDKGEIVEYIAIRHEITQLIQKSQHLEHLINYDTLTHLGNRYKLIHDIQAHEKPSLALLYIDNFREFNDFFGHAFGDKLLELLGRVIGAIVPKEHLLYRINGNEFAILNTTLSRYAFVKLIRTLIKQLENRPFSIADEVITVSITGGISFESVQMLFTTADMALSEARKGQKVFVVFDELPSLQQSYAHNIEWTKKLKNALQSNRIVPYFQPIVHIQTGEIQKYESLVRMVDEEGNVFTPFHFLDVAKKSKQYLALTHAMLRQTFDYFTHKELRFSVNLSIEDILDTKTQLYIFALLDRIPRPQRVVFEIVESEGIEKFDTVSEFIHKVQAYGAQIAIDDFGTGYSNFDYLRRLKANIIKIDGSLIRNIDKDEEASHIVKTLVDFARSMGMQTVAEFVESEAILAQAKAIGIDYAQGYYFGAPSPSTV